MVLPKFSEIVHTAEDLRTSHHVNYIQVLKVTPRHLAARVKSRISMIQRDKFIHTVRIDNVQYVPECDRLMLKFKGTIVTKKLKLYHWMLHVMRAILPQLESGQYINKRHLYYTFPKLFNYNQANSDYALEMVALYLNCTRDSLKVVGNVRGAVGGNISYVSEDCPFDCIHTETLGRAVPVLVDTVADITSDARFILLVESSAMFTTLHSSGVEEKFNCILVTGCGEPDMATRKFVSKISMTLKIPVLCVFDGDIYGFNIFLSYKYGTQSMAYDGQNLATPNLHWLGVKPTDVVPNECRRPLEEEERAEVLRTMELPYVMKNKQWMHELKYMMDNGAIDILEAHDGNTDWFATEYIPSKLTFEDWIVSV